MEAAGGRMRRSRGDGVRCNWSLHCLLLPLHVHRRALQHTAARKVAADHATTRAAATAAQHVRAILASQPAPSTAGAMEIDSEEDDFQLQLALALSMQAGHQPIAQHIISLPRTAQRARRRSAGRSR